MTDRARRGRILAAVGATQLIIILNGSIVNVALPSLQRDLGLDLTAASWVVTSYALAFGGFLLLGGRISDRIGGGRAFLIGMAGFVIASVVVGLAPNGIVLIGARTVQGLAASLLAPAGLSILSTTFSEGRERTRALGVYVLMATCGGAIGLVAGGILTSAFSWRWCFLILVPFALAALLIIAIDARGGRGHPVRIDLIPAFCITATATGITLGVVEYETPVVSFSAFLASALCIGGLILHQSRASETFIPPGIFRGELPLVGLIGAAGTAFVMMATGTLVSLFLQDVLGVSPFTTGLMLLATPVSIAVGTSLGTILMARFRPFALIVTGIMLVIGGALVLTTMSAAASYWWNILPGLALNGLGMGLVGMSSIAAVLSGAGPSESGIASAGQQMVQQIFGAVGLAVLFAVSQAVGATTTGAGVAEASARGIVATQWIAAAVCTLTIAVLFVTRAAVRSRRTSTATGPLQLGLDEA